MLAATNGASITAAQLLAAQRAAAQAEAAALAQANAAARASEAAKAAAAEQDRIMALLQVQMAAAAMAKVTFSVGLCYGYGRRCAGKQEGFI